MEKWQKGAEAVLNLSKAGKDRYFAKFPERKEWFEKNHPQHFGRSVAAATSSLNKVTKAKVKKQRLAAIRQAAEKRNQLTISSDAVRAMGERRRQSGEGLAGGMDTVADIRKSIAAGMPVRSGGLGSLFEQDSIVKKGNKFVYDGKEYNTEKDAMDAMGAKSTVSKSDFNPFNSQTSSIFGKIGAGYLAGKYGDMETAGKMWDELMKDAEAADLKGRPWPGPGQDKTDWTKLPHSNKWMSQGDQYDILKQAPAGSDIDTRGTRLPFSTQTQVGDGDQPKRKRNKSNEEEKGMYYENVTAKELAEKIMEQKRIDECMPVAMEGGDNKWDYAETWAKNPIAKGSSEAEDEPGEYDYEGDMAKSQLRSIAYNSKMLHDMLEDNTNLPEWVQSKITLAEDYILTAANYMRGEMMNEETEEVDAIHRSMEKTMEKDLPFDPSGERKPGNVVDKSGAVHSPMSRTRHLAQMAMQNQMNMMNKPESAEELVQQHNDLHMEAVMKTAKKVKDKIQKSMTPAVAQTDDLIPQSMLPDQSVIPAGQGFGDDIPMITLKKKEKIKDKVAKALNKKKAVVMPKNPSENELPTPSMLPDVPTIPAGQGMGDDIPTYTVKADIGKTKYPAFKNPRVRKEEVEQSEEQVIQEETSSYVAAGSKFLTRTSTRLVYGDKND